MNVGGLESSPPKQESDMRARTPRGVVIVDVDAQRGARIGQLLEDTMPILVANESTLALALIVRTRPLAIIAPTELGSMLLVHFVSLVGYAMGEAVPPVVAIGNQMRHPLIARVVPEDELHTLKQVVNELLSYAESSGESSPSSA